MDVLVTDNGEMRRLVADLGKAAGGVLASVAKVVEKGALNVKNDLNEQAAGSSFRGMAGSVTYDRAMQLGMVQYEVGPDKSRRGGALGNIFFFGGANGGGGTGDLDAPLKAEGPRMAKALGDLLGDVL